MKKVFCRNCKYFRGIDKISLRTKNQFQNNELMVTGICFFPKNVMKTQLKEDWYDQKIEIKYRKFPQELNKDNNCNWYEEVKYV